MQDPTALAILVSTAVAGFSIASVAALKGWQGWLDLKRMELGAGTEPARPSATTRIEVADLKERVRKLEAIANGVDF